MPALTLRGLSPETVRRLKLEARKAGVSMNRLLIEKIAGQERGLYKPNVHHDLDRLFGTMTKADLGAIEEAVAVHRRIDRELWR